MTSHSLLLRGPAMAVLASYLFAGCTSSAPRDATAAAGPSPAAVSSAGALAFLDERALLLLLSDRQVFDETALAPLLAGNEELRERLAEALGRIGDARGRRMLESLLADQAQAVRRAAAFALGELEDAEARAALLASVADADREVGFLAVEALGKLGTPLAPVLAAADALAPRERAERVLPALFRFKEDEAVRVGTEGLAESDRRLRSWAAYGLARDARPGAAPALRSLIEDLDPWVRGWAARGLGGVGEGADLRLLETLLADPFPGPVIQSLRAAQRLIGAGKAPAPPSWRKRLLALFDDRRPGVAITALEAAGSWLLDESLGAALAARARRPWSPDEAVELERESEVSLLALAHGKDPQAADLVASWAGSAARVRRLRAAEAAAALGARDVLAGLAGDAWPAVRAAVVSARLAEGPPEGEAGVVARTALADAAVAVRAAAFDWFAEHPAVPLGELVDALAAGAGHTSRDTLPDARIAAVRAIGSRGKAERLEQGAAIEQLERLAQDEEFLVRREAANALVALGRPAPPLGAATPARPVQHYRTIVEATALPREVDLRTRHGVVRLRLHCPEAPLTCLSFTQLAAQGFFDGLSFHRVVPDFVVQGGDPQGDGSGGPGYALRDEINRRRYVRGTVGMALSGPDTGGSQFFIALSPQPHLDGGYTVFGEVVEGMEVVDRIAQGDALERAAVRPPAR